MLHSLIPAALALVHGGHGIHGDSPSLLLRLEHYVTEPRHVMPAVMGTVLLVTLFASRKGRDAPKR